MGAERTGIRRGTTGLPIALAIALLSPARVGSDGEQLLPPPGDARWESLELPGVERATRYRRVPTEDGPALEAVAECGGSALAVALPEVSLAATPILRWRWWAEELPVDIDERSRGGDDFAARVSVMFAFEPERADWLFRIRQDLLGRLTGREMPGSAIHFLWTARVPPGSVWDNPRTDRAKNWALERGPARDWREAEIDVPRAYRSAFGHDPPPLLALGVMTDADDHCGTVRGYYADFRFGPREADPEEGSGIQPDESPRGRP